MTQREIKKELTRIYHEMKKLPRANKKMNYVIPKDEVEKREDLLLLRKILYQIEDARKEGDKNKEYFNLAMYYLTKSVELEYLR